LLHGVAIPVGTAERNMSYELNGSVQMKNGSFVKGLTLKVAQLPLGDFCVNKSVVGNCNQDGSMGQLGCYRE